jgi:arabinose-5-phosphate isomerase
MGRVDESKILATAGQVIDVECAAVGRMHQALDEHFVRAVELVRGCRGAVLTSGIGKAGHVARKLSATLASTGTPSHFLSAPDAVHGDIGSVRAEDVVLLISASGETDEILRVLSVVKKLGRPVIGMTSSRSSTLGRHADVTLATGRIEEACPLGLAPSASTTATMALGDALALTVMAARNFTAEQFAVFHPAGQLGRKLIRVGEAMSFRVGENLPVAPDTLTVGEVLAYVSRIKRRSGAVILARPSGVIAGIFSDGDLRRLIERNPAGAMGTPIAGVMTADPKRVRANELAAAAMSLMRQFRIDEIPVVDDDDKPVGLIDVQDLVVLKLFDVDSTSL